MKIKKIYDELMEWLFPSNIYCICCGSLIDRDRMYSLCDACMEDIHWINGRSCIKCGKALQDTYRGQLCYNCMMREHDFRRGISCMTYGLKERQMILDFKYNSKGYMGIKFGDMMADRLCAFAEDHPAILETDMIVPVPIHRERERKRGFNQSMIMAGRLGKLTGISVDGSILERAKKTELLRSMDPSARDAVMRDAFRVTERGKNKIKGATILLVDDIITTGATVDACCRALLDAGAASVDVITLACGGNRRPGEL